MRSHLPTAKSPRASASAVPSRPNGSLESPPKRRYVRPPEPLHFPVEEQVPEGKRHLELRTALYQALKLAFADRASIGCDQFLYWDATNPKRCLAPDTFVRLGTPDTLFDSWKVWERGAPELCVEIVSGFDERDGVWSEKLERYRHVGLRELVHFDPRDRAAPLRVWDGIEGDLVERMLDAPWLAECDPLGLWWVVREEADLGVALRLARDPEGRELLLTPAEAESRAREAESHAHEAESRAREAETQALAARIRELEEELGRRG